MIELHTHSLLSDGELLPEELIRHCEARGFAGVAITDHVGVGNIEQVLASLMRTCEAYRDVVKMAVIPGVELTHVHPRLIRKAAEAARRAGARIVIGHGESLVEPVAPATNRACIEAGVDILAHPGLISEEDATLAAKRSVLLEISGKAGHSLTNGHVAVVARKVGASLSFGSDSHGPCGLFSEEDALRVLRGSGLSEDEAGKALKNAERFL